MDEDDDLDEREWPDPEEEDDDQTSPCPHCGESIYDDAEQCPRCGRYLSRENAPRSYPWWFTLGFLLCLAVVLTWLFGR